ncbi:thioester reductase domain-containing protein [Streptomyces lavendulae]|uniref:thioester reductase domain-containing protein n=1 Tax=Streptomyces lavendulae TaxID=1914 RepID=UPI0036EA287D
MDPRYVWYGQQLEPESAAYQTGEYLEITGAFDPELFARALRRAVAESECMHLVFDRETDGGVTQRVEVTEDWPLHFVDVSGETDPRAAAVRWMREDLAGPGGLARPLFTEALFRESDDRHLWYHRIHHIAVDGLSGAVIAKRVAGVYNALLAGGSAEEGALAHHEVLVAADAAYRAGEDHRVDAEYWHGVLAGRPEAVTLSGRRPLRDLQPPLRHLEGIGAREVTALKGAARGFRTSLSGLVIAATAVYLHRMTGAGDLVLGMPAPGRTGAAAKAVPGMTSNILPIRLRVDSDTSLGDLFRQVADTVRGAVRHQRHRYEDLARDLRTAGTGALFGPVVNVVSYDHGVRFGDCPVVPRGLATGPVDDLSVNVYDRAHDGSVEVAFDANPARYAPEATTAHARRFLEGFLPAHMVPSAFVFLDGLPVTFNGKLDHKALPVPDHTPAATGRAPVTGLETRLCAVFAEVLAVSGVAADEDFFALGGHSLLVVRLLARVSAELGVRVGVREFLAAPTAGDLAALVEDRRAGRTPGPVAVAGDADAWLDPGLRFPAPTPDGAGREPRRILLTGATGFVGAFLLRELLTRTARTGTELLCLVRAESPEAARARVNGVAVSYGLGPLADDPRVRVLPGDLARPSVGLDARTWRELAHGEGAVDAIVHSGAHVHHLSPYERLKAANVDGTRELLRLAAEGGATRVHHLSSLGLFRAGAEPRLITEDSDTADETHPLTDGYAAGKWVADRMVGHAVARGADARVYRLGRVWADSRHGAVNRDDMYCRLLTTCAALGSVPRDAVAWADLLPADVAARALAALVLDREPTGTTGTAGVRHLHHVRPVHALDFLRVYDSLHGTHTREVPLGEWLRALRDAGEAGRELPFLPYLDAFEEYARTLVTKPAPAVDTFRSRRTAERLEALGVTFPEIDEAMITAFWHRLAATGDLA